MSSSGSSCLLLAASQEEIRTLLTIESGAAVLALTDDAKYHCLRLGIPFFAASDYCKEEEWRRFGGEQQCSIRRLFVNFDRAADDAGLGVSLRPSDFRLLFKILCDRILLQSLTLGGALDALDPKRIYYCCDGKFQWKNAFEFSGRLGTQLAPALAAQKGIQAHRVGVTSLEIPAGKAEFTKPQTTLLQDLRSVINRGHIRSIWNSLTGGLRERQAILPSYLVNDQVGTQFRAAGCHIIPNRRLIDGTAPHSRNPSKWPELLQWWRDLPKDGERWQVQKSDFRSIVDSAFEHFFSHAALEYEAMVRTASERLGKKSRPFVVSNAVIMPEQIVINAAARSLGITRFTLQHGGFNAYVKYPVLWDEELRVAEYNLCWGPGSVNAIEGDFPETELDERRAIPVAVSDPKLLGLYRRRDARQRVPNGKTTVLYVIGGLHFERRFFSPVYTPDERMCRLHFDIVSYLSNLDVDATIRLYPSQPYFQCKNPVADFIRDNKLKISIDERPTIADALDQSDVIVIDCPSTVLLQATATRAAIAVMIDDDFYEMRPQARALLERRAQVASGPQYLKPAIAAAIERARGPNRETDDGFLASFGLNGTVGNESIAKVALAILSKSVLIADRRLSR